MPKYFWDEKEIVISLNDLIGKEKITESDIPGSMVLEFTRTRDKRGDNIALLLMPYNCMGHYKNITQKKIRTNLSFQNNRHLIGLCFILVPNMLGWDDSKLSEAYDCLEACEKHKPILRPIVNVNR